MKDNGDVYKANESGAVLNPACLTQSADMVQPTEHKDRKGDPLVLGDKCRVTHPYQSREWRRGKGSRPVTKYNHLWHGHYWGELTITNLTFAQRESVAVVRGTYSWGSTVHSTIIPTKFLRKMGSQMENL
jgi:hypothetical protein